VPEKRMWWLTPLTKVMLLGHERGLSGRRECERGEHTKLLLLMLLMMMMMMMIMIMIMMMMLLLMMMITLSMSS
jgi:hypothetical protein